MQQARSACRPPRSASNWRWYSKLRTTARGACLLIWRTTRILLDSGAEVVGRIRRSSFWRRRGLQLVCSRRFEQRLNGFHCDLLLIGWLRLDDLLTGNGRRRRDFCPRRRLRELDLSDLVVVRDRFARRRTKRFPLDGRLQTHPLSLFRTAAALRDGVRGSADGSSALGTPPDPADVQIDAQTRAFHRDLIYRKGEGFL